MVTEIKQVHKTMDISVVLDKTSNVKVCLRRDEVDITKQVSSSYSVRVMLYTFDCITKSKSSSDSRDLELVIAMPDKYQQQSFYMMYDFAYTPQNVVAQSSENWQVKLKNKGMDLVGGIKGIFNSNIKNQDQDSFVGSLFTKGESICFLVKEHKVQSNNNKHFLSKGTIVCISPKQGSWLQTHTMHYVNDRFCDVKGAKDELLNMMHVNPDKLCNHIEGATFYVKEEL
jgi:hypothetical protein